MALAFLESAVHAQFVYTLTDLGTTSGYVAPSINNLGQVLLQNGSGQAMVYSGGTFTPIGTMGTWSKADPSIIVSSTSVFQLANGAETFLRATAAFPTQSIASAIATSRGLSSTTGISVTNGGIASGPDFGTAWVGFYSLPSVYYDTNNRYAFTYANGVFTDYGKVSGAKWSEGKAVNISGTVAGQSFSQYDVFDMGTVYPFRVPAGGSEDNLVAALADESYVFDINAAGVLVGNTQYIGYQGSAAWVSTGSSTSWMSSITDMAHSNFSSLNAAESINDLGQIVGTGTVGGVAHYFLASPISLTPAPEVGAAPFATALLVALLVTCVHRRVRVRRHAAD